MTVPGGAVRPGVETSHRTATYGEANTDLPANGPGGDDAERNH